MNPLYAAAVLALYIITAIVGYVHGVNEGEQKCALDKAASVERAIVQAQEIAAQDAQMVTQSSQKQAQAREVIRHVVTRIQSAPTPDCSVLSAQWVREYNAAIAAANGTHTAAPLGYAITVGGVGAGRADPASGGRDSRTEHAGSE